MPYSASLDFDWLLLKRLLEVAKLMIFSLQLPLLVLLSLSKKENSFGVLGPFAVYRAEAEAEKGVQSNLLLEAESSF